MNQIILFPNICISTGKTIEARNSTKLSWASSSSIHAHCLALISHIPNGSYPCSLPPTYKSAFAGTLLVVQWLRVRASTAAGMGSIPGWGTKILHAVWLEKKAGIESFYSERNWYLTKMNCGSETLFKIYLTHCTYSQQITSMAYCSVDLKSCTTWASLVAQWLRICLPMQGTRVRALVWEDPTCRGATGPVSHNY